MAVEFNQPAARECPPQALREHPRPARLLSCGGRVVARRSGPRLVRSPPARTTGGAALPTYPTVQRARPRPAVTRHLGLVGWGLTITEPSGPIAPACRHKHDSRKARRVQ